MGVVGGDSGAPPPAKKAKKSRNKWRANFWRKSGEKLDVHKFTVIGENGLPPVRKYKRRRCKRHSHDDDLIKVIMKNGYAERVVHLIGNDEATRNERYGFWCSERGAIFELVDEEHRQEVKSLHHFHEAKMQREPAVEHKNFIASLGTFSNILFETLWTSRVLHRCLEEGDDGARALLARFRMVMGHDTVAPVADPSEQVVPMVGATPALDTRGWTDEDYEAKFGHLNDPTYVHHFEHEFSLCVFHGSGVVVGNTFGRLNVTGFTKVGELRRLVSAMLECELGDVELMPCQNKVPRLDEVMKCDTDDIGTFGLWNQSHGATPDVCARRIRPASGLGRLVDGDDCPEDEDDEEGVEGQ